MLSKENMAVLTNVIGAVESGGQIYGKRRYDAYTPPYYNTPNEHTITLGWAQNYGAEARRLVKLIYDKDPAAFKKIDSAGMIQSMLGKDWVAIRWKPNSVEKNILIRLIDSPAGHEAQDELFAELMDKFVADCEREYTKEVKAIMMYCEIRHLGGKGPADRIFRRCGGNYSLDNIMAALNKDDPNGNQVGSKKFRSRHQKCIEFINKYAKAGTMTTIVDEFAKYIGVHEYDGIVAVIQRWYYGSLVKDAWCATSTSYFANVAGVLDQLGGKNEGVSEMMAATRRLHKTDGRFFEYPHIPKDLKRHDVIFFKREGSSHVAHCWQDTKYTGSGTIQVIGGNQSDMICVKGYRQECIQAVYRPLYEKSEDEYMFTVKTVRKDDKGEDVGLMQTILRGKGYTISSGKPLSITKKFGEETERCLRTFQKDMKLDVDGICGPATWSKLLGV